MTSAFHFRSVATACATLCAVILSFSLPARADEAAARCHGNDMLAEMQAKSPETYKKVMEESSQTPNTEAVLWKVEKPGLDASYLFGTMHLSDPRISVLPAEAKDAIAQSKSVALEVADLSDKAVAAAMTKSRDLILYTAGKTLSTELSADEYKKVEQVVTKSGMPGQLAGVLKPWLVSMLLATSDCERQQLKAGATVLDLQVAAEAKKHGLTVQGLETVEDQLAALAAVPDDQQIALLKFGLKYLDRSDDQLETLIQMYLKRQIGAAMPFQVALAAESRIPASAFEGFKQMLLINRNAKMLEAAEPLIEKGNAFIAVGALHLSGAKGLVALLRQRGYTVTPIE
jgi:hypothetical protein